MGDDTGRVSGQRRDDAASAGRREAILGRAARVRGRFQRLRPPGGRSWRVWSGRGRAVRALVALLLVAVVGLVGYALLGSSLFLASAVSVRGEHRLTDGAIRQAAAVPTAVPIARLDTGPISRRVAALPAVAVVDVGRSWPHTVRITVTERVPVLAVPNDGGFVLVDATGVAFATERTAPRRLPVASLSTVSPSNPTTKAVLGVVTALSPSLRAAMRRLEASSDSGVTLVLRDGRRVVWGANDRSAAKAEVLAALLKRKGHLYDVSAPDVVTVAG